MTINLKSPLSSHHTRARLSTFVFALFFLSGAFALIYEVSWVRAMTLHFGSTSLAISTILTAFMGGLALGAWVSGRMADRITAPLTTYGAIEILLALYALFTPILFRWAFPVFDWFGSNVTQSLWFLSLVRFVVAVILLLPPTMLMGATLPVLSRFLVLQERDGGRGAGLLYGVNTVGAFVGTLTAGLLLLPTWGLQKTIVFTAVGNLVLGVVTLVVGRKTEAPRAAPQDRISGPPTFAVGTSIDSVRPVLVAVALTGFAALVCEVAWTRVLVLVLGASIYAFTLMLATFLAGLGMGAAGVACILSAAPARARFVFYVLALLGAGLICASSATFEHLPTLFRHLYFAWGLADHSDKILPVQLLITAAVMFVPALVMGGLFPAAIRIIVNDRDQTSRRVGLLYAWNTIGAVLGSFAAGFALIPLLGVRKTLLVAVSLQCVAAVVVMAGRSRGRRHILAGIGGAFLLLFYLLTPPWHHQLMTSAMYHYARQYKTIEKENLAEALTQKELLYYRDGLTATVTVTREDTRYGEHLYIATNGKIDGSSHGDMPTQRLSAHIPLLFHPSPEQVCVIGMGTGCTAGSAALHQTVSSVTVVEIEAAMVEGARLFRDHNHAMHHNPKVAIEVTDGRLFLRLHPGRFDVVISEPSNPWMAGTSDLFTIEYFDLGARALRDGGFFCQWVQLYGMSSDSVKTIVRGFLSVFPHAYLITTIPETDILLLGSQHPFALDIPRAARRMQQGKVFRDLADPRVHIKSVYNLVARFRMGPQEVHYFVGDGPLHTDDLPIIAYQAPKDLYRSTTRENRESLARYASGIMPYLGRLPESREERKQVYKTLAGAYRIFLGPNNKEAAMCEQLAADLSTDPPNPK